MNLISAYSPLIEGIQRIEQRDNDKRVGLSGPNGTNRAKKVKLLHEKHTNLQKIGLRSSHKPPSFFFFIVIASHIKPFVKTVSMLRFIFFIFSKYLNELLLFKPKNLYGTKVTK